jgi:elongation factor G
VVGYLEPNPDAEFEFVDGTKGGVIPKQFIPAVEKGFKMACLKGLKVGYPVVNVRVVVTDGNSHAVDSSEIAFTEAARGAWREIYLKAGPRVLEPVMRVVVEGPTEFSGAVMKTLMQRRGIIIGSQEDHLLAKVEAEVPLAEMFGYATALRSSTQGKAEFTMEFSRYLQLPENLAKELTEKLAEEAAGKKK